MDKRLKLHDTLKDILGSSNVYFQPPASIKMAYPAIRYSLSSINTHHADNSVYGRFVAYEIILIDRNPDSIFIDKISSLSRCDFNRYYTAENLNHYVFTICI